MSLKVEGLAIAVIILGSLCIGITLGDIGATKRERQCTDPYVIMNYAGGAGTEPHTVYQCKEGLRVFSDKENEEFVKAILKAKGVS